VKSPTILLLQARLPDDPMREHEHRCFVDRTGLPAESISSHDLRDGPPTIADLTRHDALSVGGSGAFYVSRGNLPRFDAYLDFLREAIERGHPTFASCFGYQSIARALGGELVHDPSRAEVGTFELSLTADGREDPLFGEMPDRFMAQMGHKDRASRPPAGTLNLASSERCTYQALRVPGKPVWATQSHPELDRETNLDRFRRYVADYGPEREENLEKAFDQFKESPEASGLLRRFLERVFE
jgi:GMP synthase (glutamine-hydrolysing)